MKQKSLSTMTKSKTVKKTQKTSTKRAAGTAAADRIRQSPKLRDLRAVVINLDSRPDRLAALQRRPGQKCSLAETAAPHCCGWQGHQDPGQGRCEDMEHSTFSPDVPLVPRQEDSDVPR